MGGLSVEEFLKTSIVKINPFRLHTPCDTKVNFRFWDLTIIVYTIQYQRGKTKQCFTESTYVALFSILVRSLNIKLTLCHMGCVVCLHNQNKTQQFVYLINIQFHLNNSYITLNRYINVYDQRRLIFWSLYHIWATNWFKSCPWWALKKMPWVCRGKMLTLKPIPFFLQPLH